MLWRVIIDPMTQMIRTIVVLTSAFPFISGGAILVTILQDNILIEFCDDTPLSVTVQVGDGNFVLLRLG